MSLRVLFLCTQNSASSQMAEALLRHMSHGEIEAYSAGSSPAIRIHPLARRAMEAVGINMHEHYPKHFDRYRGQHFDAIVTICDREHNAACELDTYYEQCTYSSLKPHDRLAPYGSAFPDDSEHFHWSFPDPTRATGSEEEQYAIFKQVGLQLTTCLRLLMAVLKQKRQ